MKCEFCGSNLIWDNDFDDEDDGIISYYSCPNCKIEVNYYLTKEYLSGEWKSKNKKEICNIDDFINEHNISAIYMDWDGVITHSCQAIVDIGNKMFGTNVKGEDVTNWNFKDVFPKLEEEDMEKLFNTKLFFENLQFIKGVVDFMKRHENNIIIVTKATVENFVGKTKMLEKIGLNIPIIPIPYTVSKNVINMETQYGSSIFIDDNTNNLLESNADYKVSFREYRDEKKREWQFDDDEVYVMYEW